MLNIRKVAIYVKGNTYENTEKFFKLQVKMGIIFFLVLQVILKEKVKELNLHEVSYKFFYPFLSHFPVLGC